MHAAAQDAADRGRHGESLPGHRAEHGARHGRRHGLGGGDDIGDGGRVACCDRGGGGG